MPKVVFATCVATEPEGRQAAFLAASVRAFAGTLRSASLWVLRPSDGEKIEPAIEEDLRSIGAQIVPFEIDARLAEMPAAARVAAAAAAEARAAADHGLLIWMDPDSLVLREPDVLLLPEGCTLGWCPAHLQEIASTWDEAPDPFWVLLYERLAIDPGEVFPVVTAVDHARVCAYFSSGLVVVRPREGLLQRWCEVFTDLVDDAAVKAFFIDDRLNQTCFPQAAFAAAVLSSTPTKALVELPPLVDFPLHLMERVAQERRPWSLNDLVTCRYDDLGVLGGKGWRAFMRVDEPLRTWLDDMVTGYGSSRALL